jgi:hypothetical protein
MNVMTAINETGWTPRMKPSSSDLRDAAAQLVADALVVPGLSSLHESPLRPATGPFATSSVEKRFAPLLQAELADRITKAAKFNLIDTIVDRFERISHASNAEFRA